YSESMPGKCSQCGSKTHIGRTIIQTDIIEIQNIPWTVCEECGQEEIGQRVQKSIDKVKRLIWSFRNLSCLAHRNLPYAADQTMRHRIAKSSVSNIISVRPIPRVKGKIILWISIA